RLMRRCGCRAARISNRLASRCSRPITPRRSGRRRRRSRSAARATIRFAWRRRKTSGEALMAGRVKTWVWVVLGLVVLGILGIVTMAAAGLWFVKSHVDIRPTTTASASADFQTIRARFASQKPLIELDDRGQFLHANTDRP